MIGATPAPDVTPWRDLGSNRAMGLHSMRLFPLLGVNDG